MVFGVETMVSIVLFGFLAWCKVLLNVIIRSLTFRNTKASYQRWDWFVVGKNSVKWEPLVDPWKVPTPPPRIKSGLVKQFVIGFEYLQDFFPKVKACVLVRLRIKKIPERKEFHKKLISMARGFLGNNKAVNVCGAGWDSDDELWYNGLLDKLMENMWAYSEEQGGCFHWGHRGQYKENMTGDYIRGRFVKVNLEKILASKSFAVFFFFCVYNCSISTRSFWHTLNFYWLFVNEKTFSRMKIGQFQNTDVLVTNGKFAGNNIHFHLLPRNTKYVLHSVFLSLNTESITRNLVVVFI